MLHNPSHPCHTFTLNTMSKRKRGDKLSNDDIKEQLHLAINDRTSAENTRPKRKQGNKLSNDDIEKQLHLAINDCTSVEMAVLRLMDEFDFDLEALKGSLMGMNDPYSVVLEWRLNTFSQKMA